MLVLERTPWRRARRGTRPAWSCAGAPRTCLTELASYGVDLYRGLGGETGIDVNLAQPGSLTLARTPGRIDELRYLAGVCRHAGIPAEDDRAGARAGAVRAGGRRRPRRRRSTSPRTATSTRAWRRWRWPRARTRAASTIREGVGVDRAPGRTGRVTGVHTEHGPIACERVVLACGLWTRDLAAAAGAAVPLWPAAHVHVRTVPLDGATPTCR